MSSAIGGEGGEFIAVFSEPDALMDKGRGKDPCLTCESEHSALLYDIDWFSFVGECRISGWLG